MNKGTLKIMGILNVTPDSFSDGGDFNTLHKAIKRAKELEKQGADIIDIGGESTGPGSKKVNLESELSRIIPVIKELRKNTNLHLSIDTYKSEMARQALGLGVNMVNDITALRGDSKMASVIKEYECPVILMHNKDKTPRTTIKNKKYKDVVKTIKDFLDKRISYAKKQGIKDKQIIIDPGIGHFVSALPEYSYEIIARLQEFKTLGYPILIGASRKSFLGGTIQSRDEKGGIVSAIAYSAGASIIRIHDVKQIKWLKTLN